MYFGVQKSFEKRILYKERYGTAPSEFNIYIFRGGGVFFAVFARQQLLFSVFSAVTLCRTWFCAHVQFWPF